MDQTVLNHFSYGLYVLTTHWQGQDNGCIIDTAVQVAHEPQVVSIAINKESLTCGLIRKSKVFTISVLSEAAGEEIYKHFGWQSGRYVDKFAGYEDCRRVSNDCMAITKGTNAFVSVNVTKQIDLGSHMLFLGSPIEGESFNDEPTVTYSYYQNKIKSQE